MKILKEPLLHFLIIGAVFFLLYAIFSTDSANNSRIVVDKGRINQLVSKFQKTWNRDPTQIELTNLIEDFVLEEILYRQALEMGIDKNDSMIRRRLRQKMEFLAEAAASTVEPEQEELQAYLYKHADRYRKGNLYSFTQIYFSTDREQSELSDLLQEADVALKQAKSITGDQSLLPRKFSEISAFDIDRTLGQGFAEKLNSLQLGQWSGPLESGFGLHFIRLEKRSESEMPQLSEVREAVLRDWSYDRGQTVRQEFHDKLREHYRIIVEWPDEIGEKI